MYIQGYARAFTTVHVCRRRVCISNGQQYEPRRKTAQAEEFYPKSARIDNYFKWRGKRCLSNKALEYGCDRAGLKFVTRSGYRIPKCQRPFHLHLIQAPLADCQCRRGSKGISESTRSYHCRDSLLTACLLAAMRPATFRRYQRTLWWLPSSPTSRPGVSRSTSSAA